jgi:hypothetical protein
MAVLEVDRTVLPVVVVPMPATMEVDVRVDEVDSILRLGGPGPPNGDSWCLGTGIVVESLGSDERLQIAFLRDGWSIPDRLDEWMAVEDTL